MSLIGVLKMSITIGKINILSFWDIKTCSNETYYNSQNNSAGISWQIGANKQINELQIECRSVFLFLVSYFSHSYINHRKCRTFLHWPLNEAQISPNHDISWKKLCFSIYMTDKPGKDNGFVGIIHVTFVQYVPQRQVLSTWKF